MSHVHVCLVSDHTIPNILGLYHFKPDRVLFITTEKMENNKKDEAIVKTCKRLGLSFEVSKIIVKEDSILDCTRKIDQWVSDKEDSNFIVNLTCGTKIMSIAVYEYFKDLYAQMYYIPVPKNEFIVPFPIKKTSTPQPLKLRLRVVEYLTAYGLEVTNIEKLETYKNDALTRKDTTNWIMKHYDNLKNLLVWLSGNLRKYRDRRNYELNGKFNPGNDKEKELLEKLSFNVNNDTISKELSRSEIRYLTGGWLEEYAFNVINEFRGKGIDDVVLDIKIRSLQGNENEFDVMFTKDNALCFVECKSLDNTNDRDLDALYKIRALQQNFGLKVKSFFLTTSPHILQDGKLRPAIQARAEQFETQIITHDKISELREIIRSKLNLQ